MKSLETLWDSYLFVIYVTEIEKFSSLKKCHEIKTILVTSCSEYEELWTMWQIHNFLVHKTWMNYLWAQTNWRYILKSCAQFFSRNFYYNYKFHLCFMLLSGRRQTRVNERECNEINICRLLYSIQMLLR